MKKLFFTLFVLGCAVIAKAQNDVVNATLQHGDQVTLFSGVTALVQAHEVAADGDVITLSSGGFNTTTITKSVTIYGAGFEKDETTGTDVTLIMGNLLVGVADQTLKDVHIEGVNINGSFNLANASTVEGLELVRCFVKSGFAHNANSKNCVIKECIFTGGFSAGNGYVAENILIQNSMVFGDITCFGTTSSVLVDHCFVTGYVGGYTLKNSILSYRRIGAYADYGAFEGNGGTTGATVTNCIVTILYGDAAKNNNIFRNCYLGVDDMFSDSPNVRNYSYTATRTYELKQDNWIGDDGTEVGIRGGSGWSKAPRTPVVKSMLLNVPDRDNLKVTYEAEVR
ncbi:MAG: hypothetical protein IJ604_12565 [Prevotella sp.]|nr:hypothetical protein [Prevotella sp.]